MLAGLPTKYFVTNEWLAVHRDSSVGLATRYGLDGPRIESRWGELGCPQPSKRSLVSTPSPVQNVLGHSPV